MARSRLVYIVIAIIFVLLSVIIFFPKIVINSVSNLYQKESIVIFGGNTEITGVKYDLLSNFPNITVKIDKQISYNQKKESILELDGVYLELNPFSIFKKRYEIVKCEVDFAKLNMLREKDGRFNSIINSKAVLTGDRIIDNVIKNNIEKELEETNQSDDKDKDKDKDKEGQEGPDNKLNIASKVLIKDLKINNGVINYRSIINNYFANFDNIKITSKGKIHGNFITMNLMVDVGKVDYLFNNNKNYNFKLKINTLLDIDSRANKFIISHANVNTENVSFTGNGSFLFLKDGISINSIIREGNISLSSLIEDIPDNMSIRKDSFTSKTKVKFDGKMSGFLNNYESPVFNLNFYINNGEIKYRNKNFFSDINAALSIQNNSNNFFGTSIEVKQFDFNLPDSYFKFNARFIPIVTKNNDTENIDFDFQASIKSEMRLEHLRKIFDLDNYKMFGFIHTSQDIVGRVSDFKNNNYNNIRAEGFSYLINSSFKLPGFPRLDVKKSTMFIFPDYINVNKAEIEIAGNKYGLEGRINHYTKVITANEINGEFYVYSQYANLSRLINEIEKEKKIFQASKDYKQYREINLDGKENKSTISLPFKTNLVINSSARNLQVNKIIIENVVSKIVVNNGNVNSSRISKGYRKIYIDNK